MEEQKERVKIDEMKIIETERPRLATMLKDLQTDLAEINEKEENLLTQAGPYETAINLNTEVEENENENNNDSEKIQEIDT